MVKLIFNPKDNILKNIPESKSSKKIDPNLNPFRDFISTNDLINIPTEYIPCKSLIGLENTHFILKSWYENSLKDTSNKNLLLIGPTGCGKTTLIKFF